MAGCCLRTFLNNVSHRRLYKFKKGLFLIGLFIIISLNWILIHESAPRTASSVSMLASLGTTWVLNSRKFENRVYGEYTLSENVDINPPLLFYSRDIVHLHPMPTDLGRYTTLRLWELYFKFPGGVKVRGQQPQIDLSEFWPSSCQTEPISSKIRPSDIHKSELVYGSDFNTMTFHPQLFSSLLLSTTKIQSEPSHQEANISAVKLKDSKSVKFQSSVNSASPNSTPVVVDSGATFATTPFMSDLIPGTIEKVNESVQNLTATSSITARGFGRWNVIDVNGVPAIIEPYMQVVPDSEVRLMSPQDYFQGLNGGNYLLTKDGSWMTLPNGIKLEIPFHHSNRLPMLFEPTMRDPKENAFNFDDINTSQIHLNVSDERNQNLSEADKEFLHKHRLFTHMNFAWIAELMQPRKYVDGQDGISELDPVIKTKHASTKNCKHDRIKCAGCLLGKMKRRSNTSSKVINLKEMALKEGALYPGDRVFSDQYQSSVGGRKTETFGQELEVNKYKGGTIFCDSMSTFIYLNHQESLQAGDTLRSKHAFENTAEQMGVEISEYRADNHIFNSKAYRADCEDLKQKLDFCGVGAHHQNGVAERAIQTVTLLARTMLIDAAIHWSGEVDLDLWPLAMDHAVWVWNNTPKQGVGFSPLELFSGVRSNHSELNRLHVWGCPSYVLEADLQTSGKSIPKWSKRSRLGQFLGFSKEHSTTVGLIRNVTTGRISPQYHVVFDDYFSTVSTTFQDPVDSLNQTFSSTEWMNILQNGDEKFFPDDAVIPPLDEEWEPQDTVQERELRQARVREFRERNPRDRSIRTPPEQDDSTIETRSDIRESPPRTVVINPLIESVDVDELEPDPPPSFLEHDQNTEEHDPNANQLQESEVRTDVGLIENPIGRLRRSARNQEGNRLIWYDEDNLPDFDYDPTAFYTKKVRIGLLNAAFINSLDWSLDTGTIKTQWNRFSSYIARTTDRVHNTWECTHPLLLSAKANSADNPKWFEAMSGPHADQFAEASREEITTLQDIGAWEKVKRKDWMNVLKSTWAFKIKRFPNGLIRKFKGRFCVRGDMQIEGRF